MKTRKPLSGRVSNGMLIIIFFSCVRIGLFAQAPAAPPPEAQSLERQLDQVIASEAAVRSAPYRIQSGDELEIRTYAIRDLDSTVRVRPDGRISLLLLGDVEAAGRTTEELSKTLSSLYGETYLNPQITVIVRNFYNFQVYIGGEVVKPGMVSLSGGLTVASAIFQAGGFKEEEGPRQVVILRQGESGARTIERLNLDDVLLRGEPDMMLRPSDILYVPKHGISVYVGGEVVEPGLVQLAGRLTALSAILKARGLKSTAKVNSIVLLRDSGQGRPLITKVNMQEIIATGTGDFELQPYDIVYVPKSTIAKIDQFVDQYMRQLLPISVNFGFSYILGNAGFIE